MWEYKIVKTSGSGLFGGSEPPTEQQLNELGKKWELVATLTQSEGGFGRGSRFP